MRWYEEQFRLSQQKRFGTSSENTTENQLALELFNDAEKESDTEVPELAVLSSFTTDDQTAEITLEIAEECLQKKSFVHDKGGDAHFDVLSAFQKSVRGSDVNAALH